jgi:hypothetical protein
LLKLDHPALSIPRRWKIRIPNSLFDPDISKLPWGLAEGFGGFIVAASLGAFDVLVWLSVCFACSGPMILSALHEATLDSRVLQFLKATQETTEITTDMRARMLFLVLIGNLDINRRTKKSPLADDQSPYLDDDSPFYHIERLIYRLRIYNSPPGQGYHPSQWQLRANSSAHGPNGSPHAPNGSAPTHSSGEPHENAMHLSSPVDAPPILDKVVYKRIVEETQCRLHAMLECQYSFGTTVGSPVAFFIAAFIYTLVNTLSGLGDETHSLSLAFGFWWMTVPQYVPVFPSCFLRMCLTRLALPLFPAFSSQATIQIPSKESLLFLDRDILKTIHSRLLKKSHGPTFPFMD